MILRDITTCFSATPQHKKGFTVLKLVKKDHKTAKNDPFHSLLDQLTNVFAIGAKILKAYALRDVYDVCNICIGIFMMLIGVIYAS